jgi:ribonuclease E
VAQLPVDVSTFLINEKREWLHRLESARAIDIVLVPDPNMQTPNYSIRRVRDDEVSLPENAVMSHQIAGTGLKELDFQTQADKQPAAAPAAVQQIAPAAPAPVPVAPPVREPARPGFWSRLMGLFGGGAAVEAGEPATAPRREERPAGRHPRDHREDRGPRRPNRGDRDRGPRRDRDRDRNRNRDRHRDDRGERQDRPRGGENRDDGPRQRDRQAEPQRPQQQQQQSQQQQSQQQQQSEQQQPQQPQNPRTEQQGAEGNAQPRRRRRRGRGGRGRERQENYRPNDTQPIAVPVGHESPGGHDAPPPAMSPTPTMEASASPPPPAHAPAAPKGDSTYSVWSSSPGEGHHFDPKE